MTVTALPEIPTRPVVRRAGAHEAPAIGRVLADAFFDDPVGRCFLPSARTRRAGLERFFRMTAETMVLPHGVAHVTPGVSGAALWLPSAALETSALEDLLMLSRLARAARRHAVRAMRVISAMDAAHPHQPHWYLPQIGVATAWQGQGIGSALLRPMLERLDAERMPAYLEATAPRNRLLYERHGFAGYDVVLLPGGAEVVQMWREPQR